MRSMRYSLSILAIMAMTVVNVSAQNADPFFEHVNYKGAFGATNWAAGWTALSHYGVLAPMDAEPTSDRTITDADIPPGSTVYFSNDTTYHLSGRVFVDDGATLIIEPGTVIKGLPGDSINASVLVVARGGEIYAEGTATNPIIFTAEADDVTNPVDVDYEAKGLWGGVIILGSAPLNVAAGENNIEGIPTTEPRGIYGGDDDDDNSGVLRYVSIRHGGIAIGEGNEINGLTLGGVGRGTTIEYVEVWSNQDDGFEFFGGTVNVKHLIAGFCGDDSYDHDEGLQSKMQFIFAIQSATSGDRCGEHDGAPSSDVGAEPWAYPVIYNATFLGSGKESYNADQDQLFKMRENWGGEYKNSIFGDYAGIGVDIENKTTPDSKLRLDEGSLLLENNLWFDFAAGVVFDSLGKHDWEVAYLKDAANGNTVADPMLKGISRDQTGGLDPRPNPDGPAYRDLADFPTPIDVANFSNKIPDGYVLKQNYPNPFNPVTKIDFALPVTEMVDLSIYNILGQKVVTLVNGIQKAGNYSIQFDASSLASGWYIYRLQTDSKVMSRKMLLIK